MKEIGVLMKPDMALAARNGWKTNTRRIINPQPDIPDGSYLTVRGRNNEVWGRGPEEDDDAPLQPLILGKRPLKSPYKTGDIIWVREVHYRFGHWIKNGISEKTGRQKWKFEALTDATMFPEDPPHDQVPTSKRGPCWFKRNSLFMPRSCARTLLEVVEIRVERLQDISEDDARAEGCDIDWYRDNAGTENLWPCPKCLGFQVHGCPGVNMGMSECDCVECDTAKKMFRHLWESINGPGSWGGNPWVWKIEFKKL
jgi:hypothetical protein